MKELNITPKLFNEETAMQYVGLGKTAFRRWAKEIGSRRTFGKRVLYDKATIDTAIDAMAEE